MDNIDKSITIVTAFIDIGRGEWDNQYKRSTQFYIESFLHYLKYPYQMACYIDDRYIDEILEHYVKSPYRNKMFIPINKRWLKNNIHAWKQLELDKEIISSQKYKEYMQQRLRIMYPDGASNVESQKYIFPENQYSEYNIINHSKIDFIMHAIENGFILDTTDTITCWCDFGYFGTQHDNDPVTFPTQTLDKSKFKSDKLTFFIQNRAVRECVDPVFMLIQSPEIFTGAFWGGPTSLMSRFQELYHISVDELYKYNISDDDQHVYLRCYIKDIDLIDLKDIEDKGRNKGLLFMCK